MLFTLTLAQDDTTATGFGAGRCTAPGTTSACATADNHNLRGQVEDSLQWCRAGGVTLVSD